MPAKTTPQERKALTAEKAKATKIAKLRKQGVSWDGDGGIVAQGLVKGAPQGRTLLRKHGLDQPGMIAPSYERTPEFRAAESARRTPVAKPEPKKSGRKATSRNAKRAPRARKVA